MHGVYTILETLEPVWLFGTWENINLEYHSDNEHKLLHCHIAMRNEIMNTIMLYVARKLK